jgi:mono/diheme cytochrome c family protein
MARAVLSCIIFFALKPNLAHAQVEGSGDRTPKAEDVFQQCSGCHSVETGEKKVGPSLEGLFKKKKLRNGRPATERNIRLVIRRGGDGMPAFDGVLSTAELDQLMAFLKQR